MTTCQLALSSLLLALGTWFWLWYLTQEAEKIKGLRKDRWYDKKLSRKSMFPVKPPEEKE